MVRFASKYRSKEVEIMDGFDLQGPEMKQLLYDLKTVNHFLGGTRVTLQGIEELLRKTSAQRTITILDLGCGDGEMLRKCADYAMRKGYLFQLIGIDGNSHILKEARKRSSEYQNITFQEFDVFSEVAIPACDIALCTLFLHHFPNHRIVDLLNRLIPQTTLGVVVNDLHRSWWAFSLFRWFAALFLKTETARHDGLVSVARGFKRDELVQFCKQITYHKYSIKWKWAFRYQWLLMHDLERN
jgi:SAM-dependent methyltransferase